MCIFLLHFFAQFFIVRVNTKLKRKRGESEERGDKEGREKRGEGRLERGGDTKDKREGSP